MILISSDFEDVSDSTSYAVAAVLLYSWYCQVIRKAGLQNGCSCCGAHTSAMRRFQVTKLRALPLAVLGANTTPADIGAIGGWRAGGCGRLGRWPATGGNRRMWPVDIGADDGWRAGGCSRLSPPIPIFGPCLAIDGWVTPPSLVVLGQSNTAPRVRSGFG